MEMTEQVRAQINNWARDYKNRNAAALHEADDFAQIATMRWLRKAAHFDAAKGTFEQFTGTICANVESELAGAIIAETDFRTRCDSWDRPVDDAGDGRRRTIADTLSDLSSDRRRFWLRYDVHEALSRIANPRHREVLVAYMNGDSIRELAARAGKSYAAFYESVWEPAAKDFRKKFR